MANSETFKKMINIFQRAPETSSQEITFESFAASPLIFFKMVMYDLQDLSETADLKTRIKYYARKFFCMFGVSCMVLGVVQLVNYGFTQFKTSFDDSAVRSVSDSAASFMLMFKALSLIFQKRDFQTMFVELKELLESRNNANENGRREKYLNEYRRHMRMYFFILLSANFISCSPIIAYAMTGVKMFFSNLWFPFDEYKEGGFYLASLWEILFLHYLLSFSLGSDALLYAFISVISMKMDFLKEDFVALKDDQELDRRIKIRALVDRHNKLFELADKLEKNFELIFFNNFVLSSFVICCASFHLLVLATGPFSYIIDVIFIGSWIVMILHLCFFGQKLIDASLGVAEGIYDCQWENFDDIQTKKFMIVVMLRAQRPKRLTAMGFADISLETFSTVNKVFVSNFNKLSSFIFQQIMSSTYSYFSLLKTVYSKE